MHHPAAWQPPVTGAYLGMGTNSGTNSPSPVHGLQHPAYGMNGMFNSNRTPPPPNNNPTHDFRWLCNAATAVWVRENYVTDGLLEFTLRRVPEMATWAALASNTIFLWHHKIDNLEVSPSRHISRNREPATFWKGTEHWLCTKTLFTAWNYKYQSFEKFLITF